MNAAGAAEAITKLISGIPDLKTTTNPEDVLGNVTNQTGVVALQAKAKVTKLKLASFPSVAGFVGKIKDLAGDIGELVDKATDAIATVTATIATGLDGVYKTLQKK